MTVYKYYNKYLVLSFLVSTIYIILFNLVFGTYFYDYEVLFNGLFTHNFSAVMDYKWCPNVWFLVAPIISKLSYFFSTVSVYSIIYSIINITSLSTCIYCTLLLLKDKGKMFRCLIIIIILLLFNETLIKVNNRTVSLLVVFSSLLLYYCFSVYRKKHLLILSCLLFGLSLIIRFELVLIFLIFANIFIWLFDIKQLKNISVIFTIITVFYFISFKVVQKTYYADVAYAEKAEHVLLDRNYDYDYNLNDSASLVKIAINSFVKDDNVFSYSIYKKIVDEDKYSKVFSNKPLYNKYIYGTIYFIKYLIKNYKIDLILLFILIISFVSKTNFIRILLFSIVFFLFNLLISIYVFLPIEILMLYIQMLIFLLMMQFKKNNITYVFFMLLLLIASRYINNYTYKKEQQQHNMVATEYNKIFLHFNKKNYKVVLGNVLENSDAYNSRLFSYKHNDYLKHFYLDMFFYNNYNFYKKHNEKIFGKSLLFMDSRIDTIIKNNCIFISNDDYILFLQNYMKYVHHKNIIFKELNTKILSKNINKKLLLPYKLYFIEEEK